MLRSIARTLPLVLLAACGASEDESQIGDLGDIEGIEEAGQALTDLSAQCSVTGTTVTLALVANDIALVTKATDGKLLVNGFACSTATTTTVKQLAVTGGTGDQVVILDYLGGTFLPGVQGIVGVTVDLGAGTGDALKIRGTKGADSYTLGTAGIATNSDGFLDLTVNVNVEDVVLTLGDGADVVNGAGSVLTGGAAFPNILSVYGGAGNDSIRGGANDDFYYGGAGDDTFLGGTADDGADEVNGGADKDTMDYGLRTAALTVDIDGTGDDGETGENDDVEVDVETLKGGTVGDTLTGSTGKDTIYGGGGNDTLAGDDNDDVLYGDAGNDTFDEDDHSNGADVVNGGAGSDTVTYTARTVMVTVNLNALADDGEGSEGDKVMVDVENVTGGDGGDTITGSAVANVLDGGDGNDTLNGADGDDTLVGGLGSDTLNGGLGDDLFNEGSADSDDDDFFGNAGVDTISYALRSNPVTVTLDGTTAGGEASEGDVVDDDIENVIGGADDDDIIGSAEANLLRGGLGDDDIDGLGGDDVIDGEGGSDDVDCGVGDGDILLDATVSASAACEL